ncbi:MAG: hypothetical protein ACK4YP_10110 [Myxococcota bacterium]
MPEPAKLDPDDESLSTLREYWLYTYVRLRNDPLAAALVQPFADFGPKWDATAITERSLRDTIVGAEAEAFAADRACNGLLDRVSVAIHDGKKPDVKSPLHQLYFGSDTPSETRRPILGSQLDRMRKWPDLLSKATQPELNALAVPVATGVATADQAQAALAKARADNAKFRLDGERRQLFDAHNALVATTYGALKAIAHEKPDSRLPADWADSFFRREPRDRGPTTVAQADALVKKLQEQLAAAEQRRAELVVQAKAAEEAAMAAAAAEAALAEAKKATAEAKRKEKEAAQAAKKAKKGKGK